MNRNHLSLRAGTIYHNLAKALHALGPGKHLADDFKPQHVAMLDHLQVLATCGVIKLAIHSTYQTIELTPAGAALFAAPAAKPSATPPPSTTSSPPAVAMPRTRGHDFSPPPHTPIVNGPYIRPGALQHLACPSLIGTSATRYTAHP